MKAQKNTKIMVTCALLVALQVILARFLSINTTFVVVNFSFLAVALSGILFGPLWALAVGAVSDLIGATLFPFGAFFPGFTVTAGLVGLIYGLFLHQKGARALVNQYDAKLAAEPDAARRAALREEANTAIAAMLQEKAADTLDKVLFELSSQMKNAYSRSDA